MKNFIICYISYFGVLGKKKITDLSLVVWTKLDGANLTFNSVRITQKMVCLSLSIYSLFSSTL